MWYRPIPLPGPWVEGAALDIHTVSSARIVNELGEEEWETVRSEVGDLVHAAKYEGDRTAASTLAGVTGEFLQSKPWLATIDFIAPAPSSRPHLRWVGAALKESLGIGVNNAALRRGGPVEPMKRVADPGARRRALEFRSVPVIASGKTVLVMDDLYRSGDTMRAMAAALTQEGGAAAIYVLTFTKTRTSSGMGR